MKTSKKILTAVIFSLFGISLFTAMPASIAATTTLENTLGHNFTENYWSVLYDFAGDHLEEDYNPGPLASNVSIGKYDGNNNTDNKYYGAYVNIGNVQNLYIALQNNSWGLASANHTLYGVSPHQVLAQHFTPVGQEDIHVLMVNNFLGLLAYRETGGSTVPEIPDSGDDLYLGWTFYNQWHKFLVNLVFAANGVPKHMWFDESKKTVATPIPLSASGGRYRFGMEYTNIFVLWQKLAVSMVDDTTVGGATVIQACSAFAMLDKLTFSYIVDVQPSSEYPDYDEVVTTTEYDIGEVTDLWVVGDGATAATYFKGTHIPLSSPATDISHYNTTNDGVKRRLNGSDTYEGFGLAVINTAKMIVMDLSKLNIGNVGTQNFLDNDGQKLGVSEKNITSGEYNYSTTPVYKLDFVSKPNYILDETTEYPAPTRVFTNAMMGYPLPFLTKWFLDFLVGGFVGNISGDNRVWGYVFLKLLFEKPDFFYLTCFPKWYGLSINQDPTFTVFVEASEAIPGYEPVILAVVGITGIGSTILIIKKKKKLKIS